MAYDWKDQLVKLGYESFQLDDMVHDGKSSEASGINNQGMREQLDYLESLGFTFEQIKKYLEEQ